MKYLAKPHHRWRKNRKFIRAATQKIKSASTSLRKEYVKAHSNINKSILQA